MEEFHYYINQPLQCCATCQYSRYDSNHDERWCGHDTPPNGLRERLVVDNMGWCGQWDGDPAPPEKED